MLNLCQIWRCHTTPISVVHIAPLSFYLLSPSGNQGTTANDVPGIQGVSAGGAAIPEADQQLKPSKRGRAFNVSELVASYACSQLKRCVPSSQGRLYACSSVCRTRPLCPLEVPSPAPAAASPLPPSLPPSISLQGP